MELRLNDLLGLTGFTDKFARSNGNELYEQARRQCCPKDSPLGPVLRVVSDPAAPKLIEGISVRDVGKDHLNGNQVGLV